MLPVTPIQDPIQEDTKDPMWKSCCFVIDRHAAQYFLTMSVLTILIFFSCTMMVLEKGCNENRNYTSLLMFLIGIFIPSPGFREKK